MVCFPKILHSFTNVTEIHQESLFPSETASAKSISESQKKAAARYDNNAGASLPNYSNWATAKHDRGFKAKARRSLATIRDFVLRVKKPPPSKGGRIIPIEVVPDRDPLIDLRTNKPYPNNLITSSIYNAYNFLPRQLVAQFSKLANLYFLCVSVMQMIPSWSTTGTYTTIIPLLVFISVSMGREGYDDWRRHRQDKEENNRNAKVATLNNAYFRRQSQSYATDFPPRQSNVTDLSLPLSVQEEGEHTAPSPITYKNVAWKNLHVGDIIKLKQNDAVPADIIILSSTGIGNIAYIETMDLDGETNLKTREPLPELAKVCSDPEQLAVLQAKLTAEDPNLDLYNFEGTAEINGEAFPLSSSHIIYRGSILRNTQSILGLVVFSGEETKIRMNAVQNIRTKAPRLQKKVNNIVIFMVIFVLALAAFCTIAAAVYYQTQGKSLWFLKGLEVGVVPNLMGFIIMFNTLIPLSLYVSLEIVKVVQMLLIQSDLDMYHVPSDTPCEAHTATINEEFGQVSYIFSDKTGTLTDNMMIFRKMSVGGHAWLHDLDIQLAGAAENSKLFQQIKQSDLPKGKSRVSTSTTVLRNQRSSTQLPRTSMTVASRPSQSGNRNSTEAILQQVAALPRKSNVNGSRPSMASLARTSSVRSSGWKSTAVPSKRQNTSSTIELLRYLQIHPSSVYAKKAQFFLLSLALCHSCVPDIEESHGASGETEIENLDYQAASPDELALIGAARDMGYIMIDRQHNSMTVRTYPRGFDNPPVDELYEVKQVIEFSSARKRMSIVVKFPDGRYCVFCKGADNIIMERLRQSNTALNKAAEINRQSTIRKTAEADLVISRHSMSSIHSPVVGRKSLGDRRSIAIDRRDALTSLDGYLKQRAQGEEDIEEIQEASRKSLSMSRQKRFDERLSQDRAGPSSAAARISHDLRQYQAEVTSMEEIEIDDHLVLNDDYVLERTLEHIEEFSTEGLRTLLYGYRYLTNDEYENWNKLFSDARTSLVNRQEKIEKVGEMIEIDLELCGATAIEDKLQEGVPETIDKLRRANIKLWMLTGDKRETAINIGYSCRLIKDYSTVIILRAEEGDVAGKMAAAMVELEGGHVAHCVVVVDGHTLGQIEQDMTLMTLFIELGVKADSVICCRASPAQKASMVSAVREKVKSAITLAIGDGANDIAMIQSADVGIGITGKEGLQAARSSDYAIAQFRFLLKLLLVHGRWNYVRTCKYILGTFYKEMFFYLTQAIYQRNVLFTGSSLYETWSLSMFNTLFTSLPVLCIGILEKDLKASTLIAVPELYSKGQRNESFGLLVFLGWMLMAASNSTIISFAAYYLYGFETIRDNSVYPMGVLIFSCCVIMITTKLQLLEMHNWSLINFAVMAICIGGWFLWNMFLSVIYKNSPSKIYNVYNAMLHYFGSEPLWWSVLVGAYIACVMLDVAIQTVRSLVRPTDTDTFQELEQYQPVQDRLKQDAFVELEMGWRYGKYRDDPESLAGLNPNAPLSAFRPSTTTNATTSTSSDSRVASPGLGSRSSQVGIVTYGDIELARPTRKRDKIKKKLRFESRKSSAEYEREIQEILRRRELDAE